MSTNLHLLASDVQLIGPTEEKPWHELTIESNDGRCKIIIAVGRPYPSTLPEQYMSILHFKVIHLKGNDDDDDETDDEFNDQRCDCASYAFTEIDFFKTWHYIHLLLRSKQNDQASHAFYPQFEYEVGEALAHSSLVARLAVGRDVPECYDYLVIQFGTVSTTQARKEKYSAMGLSVDDITERA